MAIEAWLAIASPQLFVLFGIASYLVTIKRDKANGCFFYDQWNPEEWP